MLQMAEWRARGYVPDSDEEDESQGSDQRAVVASEEGFQDIDSLAEGTGDQQEKGTSENDNYVFKKLGGGEDKEERLEPTIQNQEAEKRQTIIAATVDDHNHDIRPTTNNTEPTRLPNDLDDIDELQQGHYQDTPVVQLEAELKHDLNLHNKEANQSTPSKTVNEALGSLHSSPLTELSQNSPRALPAVAQWMSPLRDRECLIEVQQPTVLEYQESSIIPERDLNLYPSSNNETIDQNPGRRNLRHRNPIQLHPYAIESEKYRQILKARGVKPLRIAQMEVVIANATRQNIKEKDFDIGEDSQLIDQGVDSQDLLITSSPSSANAAGVPTPQDLSDIFHFKGDELPDLDALLRQPFPHFAAQGNKRRKTVHTFSKREQRRAIQSDPSLPLPSHMNIADNDSMYDVPPSPPQSGSPTPTAITRPKKGVFRIPRGLSPVALPSPVTSSEQRKHRHVDLFDDSETDEDPVASAANENCSGDSETESTSSENAQYSDLKRVQRKIKGVLPASWLKLDLKANTKTPENVARIHRSTSPVFSDQRGVARLVSGVGGRSPEAPTGHRFPIELSDNEESASEAVSPGNATNAGQNLPPSPHFHIRDDLDGQRFLTGNRGEVEEDNRVDAMLPSTRESAIHARKRRMKDQTTLNNLIPRPPFTAANNSFESSRSKPTRQPRIPDRFDKSRRKKPMFRPPRLSILDAPTRTPLSQGATPPFLKVASRTVRSRNDQGRHSPSGKFLRLATANDTKDANETLQYWREGTLAQASRIPEELCAKALNRQPLYPRSHNLQFPQIQPNQKDGGKEMLRSSHSARPARNTPSSMKPRLLQSLLDHVNRNSVPQLQLSYDRQRIKPSKVRVKFKKRGRLLSSLQTPHASRPALLESLQQEEDQVRRGSAFKRDLIRIDQTRNQAGEPSMPLARFFKENPRASSEAMHMGLEPRVIYEVNREGVEDGLKLLSRRRKKRQPHRIDTEALNVRQIFVSLPVDDDPDRSTSNAADDPPQQLLIGFGPFGTRYTDNFDIHPLSEGTCFHGSTFIGSGEFLKSLNMTRSSDLDRPRGFMSLSFGNNSLRWGPWNDKVSEQLGQVFDAMCQELRLASTYNKKVTNVTTHEQIILLQRNIIRYFSNHLSFLDPVDRDSYLQRLKGLVLMVFGETDECVPASGASGSFAHHNERSKAFQIRLGTLLLVVVNQLRQVSEHELVPKGMKDEINSLVLTAARRNLTQALGEELATFRQFLADLKHFETSTYTIEENYLPIEALVIGQHVTRESTHSMAAFWEIVNGEVLVQNSGRPLDVRVFEDQWQKLYYLLPFLEFDAQGILEPRLRFQDPQDNWLPLKRMINQVLEVYMSNPRTLPPSFNAYCRALFSRCLHLINTWGWERCESIIGTLFDFFARNNLAHLRNEQSHGSPTFLEHLDQVPLLETSPKDQCFHILLRIIGSGLKRMRQNYPEKKIRDIVWRLMPNHGRSHLKEEAIRQEDLDALRNHHDLLCTLYWAAPPGIRPRLSVIRNLVQLESSHRQACHISIRAWSNLVRFQISTNEPLSSLEPFADWHEDLLEQILRQHGLARTEAEEHVRSAQRLDGPTISKDLLESTISRNQRHAEAILSDALISLKRAIDEAGTWEAAGALLAPTLTQVYLLFDAGRSQVSKSIIEALDVLLAYLSYYSKSSNSQIKVHDSNDDSQDYGDWSGFNDADDSQLLENDGGSALQQTAIRLQEIFLEPLRHLLSNCFGADTVPNDALLSKLIEVWVAVARCLIRHGAKSWSDYISRFGHDSWASLRDTEQTRKFTAYFLAVMIETDNKVYEENKSFFVISWITSLVERESMLKFQHRFTSALLNVDISNPLLGSLPFYASRSTNRVEITTTEFSQRRLLLISSILSNMRESVEDILCISPMDAAKLKQEYKEILKHLMLTMKQRYQELGHGSDVRGSYVDFVHQVVEFLQQHTSAICPVDRFFMDSAVFPLPAKDPTYVVGQLKNYGLRLQDSRTPKQLAVFIQSVSERAMVDAQQEYLVGQLHTALANAFESGDPRKPTLRAFVVKAIVPAYIEVAFSTASGWLLASPMLQALEKVFSELLTDLDGTNPASVTVVLSTITVFLDCSRSSFDLLVDHSGLLDQPKVLNTLVGCYSATTAAMPVLDYITRLSGASQHALSCIDFFKSFATFVSELLLGHSDPLSPGTDNLNSLPPDHDYADVRKFAVQELRETLNRNWVCHDEQYHVVRGNSRREVMVDIGSYADEKEGLMVAIQGFRDCLSAMPALRGDDEENLVVRRLGGTSLDDALLS